MDPERAKAWIEELVDDYTSTLTRGSEYLALAQTALDHGNKVRTALQGLAELYPDHRAFIERNLGHAPAAMLEDGVVVPRGSDAVARILQESPDYPFLVSEVVRDLRARGWLPDSENPANAVRAALDRLVANPDSDVIKSQSMSGKVVYVYAPDVPRYEEDPERRVQGVTATAEC